MRGSLLSLAAAVLLLCATPARATNVAATGPAMVPAIAAPSVVALSLQEPPKDFRIDINVNRRDARWYANPVWIGLGVLVLLLIVVLVALAARGGGGTTVVKE